MRVAVLTTGGDVPGINAAIRAVVRTGIDKRWLVWRRPLTTTCAARKHDTLARESWLDNESSSATGHRRPMCAARWIPADSFAREFAASPASAGLVITLLSFPAMLGADAAQKCLARCRTRPSLKNGAWMDQTC